jgi:hypothetical protein
VSRGPEETERHKERERERQKDKKTERQKDRKTKRQKDKKTERQKDRKSVRKRKREPSIKFFALISNNILQYDREQGRPHVCSSHFSTSASSRPTQLLLLHAKVERECPEVHERQRDTKREINKQRKKTERQKYRKIDRQKDKKREPSIKNFALISNNILQYEWELERQHVCFLHFSTFVSFQPTHLLLLHAEVGREYPKVHERQRDTKRERETKTERQKDRKKKRKKD